MDREKIAESIRVWMPPVLQAISSIFGGVFDRTCVRPLSVAFYDATGGSCCSEGWVHIGSESCKRSSPGSEFPCLELRSPYRVLLVDRSPWPCGHVVPFSFLGIRSHHSIILLLCRNCPDHPRCSRCAGTSGAAPLTVRQGNGCHHLRFACHQCGQPAVFTAASTNHPADYARRAERAPLARRTNDQQSTDVSLPHFAD